MSDSIRCRRPLDSEPFRRCQAEAVYHFIVDCHDGTRLIFPHCSFHASVENQPVNRGIMVDRTPELDHEYTVRKVLNE